MKSLALATLLVLPAALAPPPAAAVSTTTGASIVVLPAVLVGDDVDSVIELTNTQNLMVHARCYYFDENGIEAEFALALAAQQPTMWVASQGRAVQPLDPPCTPSDEPTSCLGAGIDPGNVPALTAFRGELVCVQTDASGASFGANGLTAAVTLKHREEGSLGSYNGVGFRALMDNGDNTLLLDGIEFEGCPNRWMLDHYAHDSSTLNLGTDIELTQVVVVPGTQNLATSANGASTIGLRVTTETGQTFGTTTTVSAWDMLALTTIGPLTWDAQTIGSIFVRTEFLTLSGSGVIPIVVETFDPGFRNSVDAANLHHDTTASDSGSFTLAP